MGEKKMLEKERKSPSQKKAIAPAKPKPWDPYFFYFSKTCSCPSLSQKSHSGRDAYYERTRMIRDSISGSRGAITKSWTPPSSSCGAYQTCPQLVSTKYKGGFCFFSGTGRKKQNRVIEPFSGKDEMASFVNYVEFQGKRYAVSVQGCLALAEVTSRQVLAFGRHRVVPRCKESKHFREHMFEYNGDIYLVFLLSRVTINVVDGVEVSRLDTSRLEWEKVDRLKGDAMFFLQDDGCMGISASKLGCSSSKGSDCVYFTHDRADDGSWFVYDMETSCISTTFGPQFDQIY